LKVHKHKLLMMTLTAMMVMASLLICTPSEVSAWESDLSDNNGWSYTGDMSIYDGKLMIAIDECDGYDVAYHQLDYDDGVLTYDVNMTVDLTTFDTSKSRFKVFITDHVPDDTLSATLNALPGLSVEATGYGGARTLYCYSGSDMIDDPTFSLSTEYHISMRTQQADNETYFDNVRIWTTGSWESPDVANAYYWHSGDPPAVKYTLFTNDDSNQTGVGAVSGWVDDYSDNFMGPIELIPGDNPLLDGGALCESSIIFDGDQLDMWVAGGYPIGTGDLLNVWYTYATNSTFSNWAEPIRVLQGVRFPTVVENNGTYYCFGSHVFDGDVYLWSSTNKVDWTPMNGGDPIIEKSADTGNLYYHVFNTGVCVVDGVFHVWIECNTDAGWPDPGYNCGYTYSTIEDMAFDERKTQYPVMYDVGNTQPVYVPERDAYIIFAAKLNGSYPTTYIQGYYTVSNPDLTSSSDYVLSPYYIHNYGTGVDVSDPSVAFTGGLGDYEAVYIYFYGQPSINDLYQGYFDETPNEFYDALTAEVYDPTPYMTWASTPVTDAEVSVPYSYDADTVQAGATYAVVDGPAWLSIDPATGVLSGTPVAAGSSDISISATYDGIVIYQNYTLTVVVGLSGVTFTSTPVATAVNGTAYSYDADVNVSGVVFSLIAGPSWLSINSTTGVVSGIPDATGEFTVTIRATLEDETANQTYTLTVSETPAGMSIINLMLPSLIILLLLGVVIKMAKKSTDSS